MPDVVLSPAGLQIAGDSEVLLCASLFSFRIPRELWPARLDAIRDSGYRAIDLYVPWNHHEVAPGTWNFDGERDVAAFLDLAHERGLYVIARPGPYICSEWDGGGLPAWLSLEQGLRIRQAEPRFLAHVAEWFDRVLPVLAARQHGEGGAVIAVQLENELDFFDTDDRAAYIGALRDLAIAHRITVPLIACAGQGDLVGATGAVDGVLPTANFYPSDDSPFIEPEVRHYAELLAERGLPLFVTETNRAHRTLRRLLVSGASMIAPYLQASGFNHGYTPSVGNWGDPGGFMSHDYDFGGFLSPVGQERPEMAEARILAGLVRTLGPALANGSTAPASGCFTTTAPTSSSPSRIALAGGGELIGIPHLGTEDARAVLTAGSGLPAVDFDLPAQSCALVLRDLPLPQLGRDAVLALATADLVRIDGQTLEFASAGECVIAIRGTRNAPEAGAGVGGVRITRHDDIVVVAVPAPLPGQPVIVDGGRWHLRVRHPRDFCRQPAAASSPRPLSSPSAAAAIAPHEHAVTSVCRLPLAIGGTVSTHSIPPTSEQCGVYRGRMRYSAAIDPGSDLLIAEAGDILDLGLGSGFLASTVRFGAVERIAVDGSETFEAIVETWGHPNFDDGRLPGLKLGSMRGLGRVWSITAQQDVGALWRVEGQWAGSPAPLRDLGGWSSTRLGDALTYRRTLPVDDVHEHALRLGLDHGTAAIEVDGRERTLHAGDPWVILAPGEGHEIAVRVAHAPGALHGATLLTLEPVHDWTVIAQPDAELIAAALVEATGERESLPVRLDPGSEVLLEAAVPAGGLSLRFTGRQVRLSVFAAGRLLGRVWLDDPQAPPFTGGDPNRIWLPAVWNTGRIRIIVHATAGSCRPELTELIATSTAE